MKRQLETEHQHKQSVYYELRYAAFLHIVNAL
jgi:hypothetical protein